MSGKPREGNVSRVTETLIINANIYLKELIFVKCLEDCLACSKLYISIC